MQATRSFPTSWCAEIVLAAVLAVAAAGAHAAATIDPDLASRLARDRGEAQRYPVIIRLAQQPDIAAFTARVAGLPQAQRGGRLLEALKADVQPRQHALLTELKTRQAERVVPLLTLNAVAAQLGRRDIAALAARADVASIRYDLGLLAPSRRAVGDPCKPARPTPPQRLPRFCRSAGLPPARVQAAAFDPKQPAAQWPQALGAPAAWAAGVTGKGVTIAIVDTGVDAGHPDLAGSFRGRAGDWFDVHGEHALPVDRHGHGTQMAGVLTGAARSGHTLGMAPQAQWIAARVYNNQNIGRLSDLHRVMAWLLDPDANPDTPDTPQIVLNAWGLADRVGACDTEFVTDVAWLRAAGLHVVFAAGNGGPLDNSSVSPANYAGVLAVGALDAGGAMASFTSRGVSACDARPYPDLLTIGEMVRTTDLAPGAIASYTYGTGTSFAAALIAGQLALLQQARPDLPPRQRESLLGAAAPSDARPPLVRALGLPVGEAAGPDAAAATREPARREP